MYRAELTLFGRGDDGLEISSEKLSKGNIQLSAPEISISAPSSGNRYLPDYVFDYAHFELTRNSSRGETFVAGQYALLGASYSTGETYRLGVNGAFGYITYDGIVSGKAIDRETVYPWDLQGTSLMAFAEIRNLQVGYYFRLLYGVIGFGLEESGAFERVSSEKVFGGFRVLKLSFGYIEKVQGSPHEHESDIAGYQNIEQRPAIWPRQIGLLH